MTLERRKFRSLTIAFMHDNLQDIIKQRYAAYSRGSCLWSGDTESLTVFGAGKPKIYSKDTDEYQDYIGRDETGINYSIYFVLGEWTDEGAEIVMPDGFGYYRIRTKGYNSISNLINQYTMVKDVWKGPFAGIPFELGLTNRQGNGPDGKKRSYPVFTFALKPRGGEIRLTSGNFRQLVQSGNRAAADLALPAPRAASAEDDVTYAFLSDVEGPQRPATQELDPELLMSDAEHAEMYPEDTEEDWARYRDEEGLPSVDDAADADDAAEFKDAEPTETQLKQLEQNKDQAKMTRLWHATVKGSFLDSKEGRSEFLARHVDGLTSLKDVVGLLKAEQFDELVVAAADEIAHRQKEDAAQAKLADPQGWHESITPRHARQLVELVQLAKLKRTEVYPFISMIVKRPVSDRAEVTAADVDAVLGATGTLTGETWTYSEARASDRLMDFASWQTSDESAMGVL